jgi:hypothetical protein
MAFLLLNKKPQHLGNILEQATIHFLLLYPKIFNIKNNKFILIVMYF